jgi:CubicO group peptidase (beta-lactamase class C family)
MKETQFRVLYRQFLFRVVDLELLSADAKGDMNKLFGQFAALLIVISIGLSVVGAAVGGAAGLGPVGQMVTEWSGVHFMIATTMLVVGLFAILSWDSTFPDRRDVMVLGPLPIRTRTIFFAKVAAVATALSVTVAMLHIFTGFVWPFSLNNRHEAVIAPSIAYDAAMAPLNVAGLESVLNRDLEQVLRIGPLAPGTGGGVSVGVWKRGEQRVFAYGTARPDSIFEIGSVSKTFTALALAQLVATGKARLDEPVRELLPPDTVARPEGTEITLLDLATHRSGLPGSPNNLHSADRHNPFAGYNSADLYAFMKGWGVAKPPHAAFEYSNLGFGLLGQALANRAGVSYAELVNRITEPLGMHDTAVNLSPEQKGRLIQGYAGPHTPVDIMDLGALAGAGAIRSTAGDMLRYLAANLHPETTSGLRAAIELQHEARAQTATGASIALSWFYDSGTGTYFHNGGTPGHTSYVFFDPRDDYAAVVLMNSGSDLLAFDMLLGEHIRERIVGEPAISLGVVTVPAGGGGILDLIRLLAVWWITMLLAGAFIFCCVLGAQGLAAQLLPRRHFLRASSFLQLAAFGVFVAVYFLEPKLVTPGGFAVSQSSAYLAWSPSYWFLGLFQQLNRSPALAELAKRAWIGIAVAFGATAFAYTLAYFRTMRKIVEEPDIAPAARWRSWLPRFGNGFDTAIGQFSLRTALRSRQHRLMLAFYLGIGFATAILFPKWPVMQELSEEAAGQWAQTVSLALMGSTILVMILCVVGTRVMFSLPMDMRANWVFRITPIPGGPGCMAARRRALYAISVVPVCLGCAALLFAIWPWQPAAKHVAALALLGTIVAELCLHGTQKLPFTCSYLPGKSRFNMTFLISFLLVFNVIAKMAQLERRSFEDAVAFAVVIAALAGLAICAGWSASRLARLKVNCSSRRRRNPLSSRWICTAMASRRSARNRKAGEREGYQWAGFFANVSLPISMCKRIDGIHTGPRASL